MKRMFMLLSAAVLAVTGCANSSENIAPTYVSPLVYQSYNCQQIAGEVARVGRRVAEVSGQQDEEADGDTAAMTVGLVLFWPALFFLDGTDREPELARLKGEYEALEQAAIQKDCSSVLQQMEEQRERARRAREEREQKQAQAQ